MGKTIGEIIQGRSDFYRVLSSDSVTLACQYMHERKVGAVAVQDGNGNCCGVFSERDLLNRVVASGKDPNRTSVGDVMTRKLVTARPEESGLVAAARMKEKGTRHLLVMDGERSLGMVTQSDLTKSFLDEASAERDLLRHYAFPELAE